MAILQVRDVEGRLYSALKGLAKRDKRSVSQEVIFILERHLAEPPHNHPGQTEEFLQLSGALQKEEAERILRQIRRSRRNSRRFSGPHGLFA